MACKLEAQAQAACTFMKYMFDWLVCLCAEFDSLTNVSTLQLQSVKGNPLQTLLEAGAGKVLRVNV